MFVISVWYFSYTSLLFVSFILRKNPVLTYATYVHMFFIFIFTLELGFIVSGRTVTFVERSTNKYLSPYYCEKENYYRTRKPNENYHLDKKEYNYSRTANSLGYPDVEWQISKKEGELRILCLGDSFTEGDGAHNDSSYVSFLRRKIKTIYPNSIVMNAGVCGSDPFFDYINYRDRLSKYKPDIIIQTLSTNDMLDDIRIRGGMERFQPNKTIKYSEKKIEPLYAISHITRILYNVAGYNYQLLPKTITAEEAQHMDADVVRLLHDYTSEAKENYARLLIVLQPNQNEADTEKFIYDFTEIQAGLNKDSTIYVYDLSKFYKKYSQTKGKHMGSYYWPIDGHHNANGYEMMSEGILDALMKYNMLPQP